MSGNQLVTIHLLGPNEKVTWMRKEIHACNTLAAFIEDDEEEDEMMVPIPNIGGLSNEEILEGFVKLSEFIKLYLHLDKKAPIDESTFIIENEIDPHVSDPEYTKFIKNNISDALVILADYAECKPLITLACAFLMTLKRVDGLQDKYKIFLSDSNQDGTNTQTNKRGMDVLDETNSKKGRMHSKNKF